MLIVVILFIPVGVDDKVGQAGHGHNALDVERLTINREISSLHNLPGHHAACAECTKQ